MISGYERYTQPLAPRRLFFRRVLDHGLVALVPITVSLAGGMAGYHWAAGKSWIDSFLNASMLLGGMGPVGDIDSWGGKLFAGLYALYCGLLFIFVSGVVLAPILHRVMHRLHLDSAR